MEGTVSPDVELVCTDESRLYHRMPFGMNHEIVNYSEKEWVRGIVHTGSIDGYWGLLKRAIIGNLRIPGDADRRSGTMAITIPG